MAQETCKVLRFKRKTAELSNQHVELREFAKMAKKAPFEALHVCAVTSEEVQHFYWSGNSLATLGLLTRSIERVHQWVDGERSD